MSIPDPPARARVIAVIRAIALDAVMERLAAVGPRNLLIEQVRGYGRQKEHLEFYEQEGSVGSFLPKVRVEFVVDGGDLEAALAAVAAEAQTGRLGDGKVFVHAVEPPA